MTTPEVQFRYWNITRTKTNWNGRQFEQSDTLTLATKLEGNNVVAVGWAMTNGDKPVKSMGRKIASGRLNKFPVKFKRTPNTPFMVDFFRNILLTADLVDLEGNPVEPMENNIVDFPERYRYPLQSIAFDIVGNDSNLPALGIN